MKRFLKEKIGQQTVAGILVLLAFPFVYLGSQHESKGLILFGMFLIAAGVVAAPCITFIDDRKKRKRG